MTSLYNHFKLLQQCETLKQLRQIHAQVITQGLLMQMQHLSCKILNTYSRFGQTSDAQSVFVQIPEPDAVSCTSLMSLYLQNSQPRHAMCVFSQMIISGLRPDGFAIVGALSAAGQIEDSVLGKSLHGMTYRCELGGETVVNNALIDMYCRNGKIEMARSVFERMVQKDAISWSSMLSGYNRCGGLEMAQQFFDQMPHRDTVCWTVMITGYVQGGNPMKAIELFYQMKLNGHHPTLITIIGVLSACADVGALDLGCSVHGYICKISADPDTIVCNALIDMYAKSGWIDMAVRIFRATLKKDIYTWTTMISGFAVHGDGELAIEVFNEMLRLGVSPNQVTFLSVLLACSHAGLIHEGQRWFDIMLRCYKFRPNIEHYGCMVDLLSRAGLLREAEMLINGMEIKPDVAIWRSLLSACLVHDNAKLSELAGKRILELEPGDDGAYVLLWNMYAHSENWKEALEMRKMMRTRNVIKKPASSWIEVNGIVHEFLVEDNTHHLRSVLYLVLEGMEKQMRRNLDLIFELGGEM